MNRWGFQQIAFWVLGMLFIAAVQAADEGPAVTDYPAQEVADGVFVIHGPLGTPSEQNQGFMNNPAFIVTSTGVVVVDPGSSVQTGEMVLRQIRKVTDLPVKAVLNTHVHGDHWLGNDAINRAYPGVPIYGHPKMLEKIKQGAGQEWIDMLLQMTHQATAGTKIVGPNLQADHQDRVELAGLEVHFLYLPKAHSDTDLMIEIPSKSLIFLGDNAMMGRFGRMSHGTLKGNIEALDLAMELSAIVYVPGHGPTGDISVPKTYQRYLQTLRDGVTSGMDDGSSDYEMKPKIVEALAEYRDWVDFDQFIGPHISQAYLELESESF